MATVHATRPPRPSSRRARRVRHSRRDARSLLRDSSRMRESASLSRFCQLKRQAGARLTAHLRGSFACSSLSLRARARVRFRLFPQSRSISIVYGQNSTLLL